MQALDGAHLRRVKLPEHLHGVPREHPQPRPRPRHRPLPSCSAATLLELRLHLRHELPRVAMPEAGHQRAVAVPAFQPARHVASTERKSATHEAGALQTLPRPWNRQGQRCLQDQAEGHGHRVLAEAQEM